MALQYIRRLKLWYESVKIRYRLLEALHLSDGIEDNDFKSWGEFLICLHRIIPDLRIKKVTTPMNNLQVNGYHETFNQTVMAAVIATPRNNPSYSEWRNVREWLNLENDKECNYEQLLRQIVKCCENIYTTAEEKNALSPTTMGRVFYPHIRDLRTALTLLNKHTQLGG